MKKKYYVTSSNGKDFKLEETNSSFPYQESSVLDFPSGESNELKIYRMVHIKNSTTGEVKSRSYGPNLLALLNIQFLFGDANDQIIAFGTAHVSVMTRQNVPVTVFMTSRDGRLRQVINGSVYIGSTPGPDGQ